MTDRETLAYIKGLVELAHIDIDLQDLIVKTIDTQLSTSQNIILPADQTVTVPYTNTDVGLPNLDYTVTSSDNSVATAQTLNPNAAFGEYYGG
jgi:hypothetical protein